MKKINNPCTPTDWKFQGPNIDPPGYPHNPEAFSSVEVEPGDLMWAVEIKPGLTPEEVDLVKIVGRWVKSGQVRFYKTETELVPPPMEATMIKEEEQ